MFKGLKHHYAALGLCGAACVGWSYVLDLQYYHLYYYSWDLPLYANLMWNLCHGSTTTSLFGSNFLIDHFNAVAFLLVPFYFFFQSALTLLYFKLFAFFAGAYVFYLLAYKRFGGFWAIALMLAYMFYPANVSMIFFEFNFENLALPLIFLLFYFFEEKKYMSFMACCFLLTTVKENMPLVVFMFGVYGLLTRKEDRISWGAYPMILGALMFFAEVFVFTPYFREALKMSKVSHWKLYEKLGSSPLEIFRTLLLDQPKVFSLLFSGHNLAFLSKLFGPLLIAALLAPQVLFLATPLFLQDLLSSFAGQQSIDFFYSSTLTVFIFMASIESVNRFPGYAKAYLLSLMIVFLLIFDAGFIPQWQARVVPYKESQEAALYFLSKIPPDAKILSSYKFLYLLSQRKDLHILLRKHNVFTFQLIVIPQDVNYMAADFTSRVDHKEAVKDLVSGGLWKVQSAADDVVILKKNMSRGELLLETSYRPLSSNKPLRPSITGGDAVRLEDLRIPRSLKAGQRIMPVVFYWNALKTDSNRRPLFVSLSISQSNRRIYVKDRRPLYGMPLDKGEYSKEVYYYLIPPLSPGNYQVAVYFLPPRKRISARSPHSNGVYVQNISVL